MAFDGPVICPVLRQLSRKDVIRIWAAVSHYIRVQLLLNKAVKITGIGTFFLVKERFDGADKDAPLFLRRPAFLPSEAFVTLRGLKAPDEKVLGKRKIVPLDYPRIASEAVFAADTVQACVEETVFLFACYLQDGGNVDFDLQDMGLLSVCGNEVRMSYYDNFLLMLDLTGHVMKALADNPQTEDSVIIKKDLVECEMCPACVLVFPGVARDLAESIPVPSQEAPAQQKGGRKMEGKPLGIKEEEQQADCFCFLQAELPKEGSSAGLLLSKNQLPPPNSAGPKGQQVEAKEDKREKQRVRVKTAGPPKNAASATGQSLEPVEREQVGGSSKKSSPTKGSVSPRHLLKKDTLPPLGVARPEEEDEKRQAHKSKKLSLRAKTAVSSQKEDLCGPPEKAASATPHGLEAAEEQKSGDNSKKMSPNKGSAASCRLLSREQLAPAKVAEQKDREGDAHRGRRKKQSQSHLPAIQDSSAQGKSGKQAATAPVRIIYWCPKCGKREEEQKVPAKEATRVVPQKKGRSQPSVAVQPVPSTETPVKTEKKSSIAKKKEPGKKTVRFLLPEEH